jgi:electron transport complex protein RnfE
MKKLEIVKSGVITSNPVFRLMLGTCPTLAVTTAAINGIAMGAAVIFVLVCSNVLVSLLRNIIPDKVRIPAFVVIIATFVTIVQMVMRKFVPDLYDALGIFLPLIVVNCVILARAEAFASLNPVADSALDGLSMGVGFMISLTIMGMVRELLGAGSFFGIPISGVEDITMTVFILPAGGFITYGMLLALVNFVTAKLAKKADAKKLKEEAQ